MILVFFFVAYFYMFGLEVGYGDCLTQLTGVNELQHPCLTPPVPQCSYSLTGADQSCLVLQGQHILWMNHDLVGYIRKQEQSWKQVKVGFVEFIQAHIVLGFGELMIPSQTLFRNHCTSIKVYGESNAHIPLLYLIFFGHNFVLQSEKVATPLLYLGQYFFH